MKNLKKAVSIFLIIVVTLFLIAFYFKTHIAYFFIFNHIPKEQVHKMELTPTNHIINDKISFDNTANVSGEIMSLKLPWNDIASTTNYELGRTFVRFKSGDSVLFHCMEDSINVDTIFDEETKKYVISWLNLKSTNDNYEFSQKLYSIKPSDYSLFMPKNELAKMIFAIPMKSLKLMTNTYIYNFTYNNVRGFQYDNVLSPGINLEIYNDNDQLCIVYIKSKSINQEEIDFIIANLKFNK